MHANNYYRLLLVYILVNVLQIEQMKNFCQPTCHKLAQPAKLGIKMSEVVFKD